MRSCGLSQLISSGRLCRRIIRIASAGLPRHTSYLPKTLERYEPPYPIKPSVLRSIQDRSGFGRSSMVVISVYGTSIRPRFLCIVMPESVMVMYRGVRVAAHTKDMRAAAVSHAMVKLCHRGKDMIKSRIAMPRTDITLARRFSVILCRRG